MFALRGWRKLNPLTMKSLLPHIQVPDRAVTKSSSYRKYRRTVPILAGAILSLYAPLQAMALTWDSDANAGDGATDGSGTWNTSLLNWFDGVGDIAWPNTLLDAAIFGNGGTAGVVTLGVPITVGTINFEAVASGNYTLGSLTNPATETLTIAGGGTITANAAGTSTIATNILIDSAGTMNIAGTGNLAITGVVGSGALNKSSTGTLNLSAANTYAGGTLLTAGTLSLTNNAALGTGTVAFGGGLIQAGVGPITVSNPITIAGNTGVSGMNNLTFSGPITNTNTTNIGIEARGVGATTTLSGPLYLSEDAAGKRILRLQNGGGAEFSRMVVSGVISDANVAYTGADGHTLFIQPNQVGSSILLSGANTYGTNNGGVVSITNIGGSNLGTVILGNATAFGTSTVNFNQSKLSTDGSSYTIANNITFAGGANVPSSFVGSGNLTVTGLATNNSATARFNVNGTGVLTLAGGLNQQANPIFFGGTGDLVISGPFSGTIAAATTGLTLKGPGTLTLMGNNTRTGGTFVDGGTLILNYTAQNNAKLPSASALGFNGGSLVLAGGSNPEVVSATNLFSGSGSATNISRTSGTSTLQLNTVTRGANSTTLNVGENNLVSVNNLNVVDGIIGGWFTVGRADWAMNSTNAANGQVIALTTYEAGGEGLWNATQNALLTGSTALTVARTVNTLKVAPTGAGPRWILPPGGHLRLPVHRFG
jgi:fibronectin-binding autotransporter adhesin